MRNLQLLFLLHFISTMAYGQNKYNVDSLNHVVTTSTNDTVKIKTLAWIFDNYLYSNPDSAKLCYEKMFAISKLANFDLGFYNAYLYKSTYYWGQSNFDSVAANMKNALKYARILGDSSKISTSINRLAMAYSSLGNYKESKRLTYEALEIALKSNDWFSISYAYNRLGNAFYYENDFENALVNYLRVDSIMENRGEKEPFQAAALLNIGNIYQEFENVGKAEAYFMKSKKIYEDLNREEGAVYCDKKLGELEFLKGNYEQCISLLEYSLTFYSKIKNLSEMADIGIYIANAYLNLNNINEAERYYKNATDDAIQAKIKMLEANGYVGLAEVQKKKGQVKPSIENLVRALSLYNEMGVSLNKPQILKNLGAAYEEIKDYKAAINYYRQYYSLTDSISKKENQKAVEELETKYQTEKKEQEIHLLKSQNELAKQQKANQRNGFLAGSSVLGISLLGLFFLYRNKQKTTSKLKELDELKSGFFANISHEFRTPLTLITGPIQQRLENNDLGDKDRSDFEMIDRNNQRLLSLVDQLLDLSKIEAGNLRLQVEKGNILSFTGALAEAFNYSADQKNIIFECKINNGNQLHWFDKDALEKIVVNLLSNAIKYTPEKGSVLCKAGVENNQLHFMVRNTGKGLNKEQLNKVFDRFYQVDGNQEGTGIGLALVKELVSLHKGTIDVDSEPGVWTSFAITLPVTKGNFSHEEFGIKPSDETSDKNSIEIAASVTDDQEITEEGPPILLVVEDNPDVKALLKNTFKDDYQILTASDGEKGVELALEHIPDLVISDVMMPVKDGIALMQELKGDERTSHVPIILLTAKAGEENELKGIETGADDYMTKPFNNKILIAKVARLIEIRKQLQSRYSHEVILRPKDIAISNIDEQFLEKVQIVLDDQLVGSSFTTEEFSKAVAMSRMQLHRKLKALTGLSASEFIRTERLKLAAKLLKKSDINVSQIGYTVGFNDPSYFTKCFKETYNCPPSEYANRN